MSGDESGLAEADSWRALGASWPGYIVTVDAENRLTSLNRNTSVIDACRDLGRDVFDFITADAQAAWRADLAAARTGNPAVTRRLRIQRADGVWRWYESRFVGLPDSAILIVSTDVTEEESAKAALGLMAEASREFSEATADYERLLSVIARRLADLIGDLCSIRAMNEAGTELEAGAVYHPDPGILALAEQLGATYSQRLGEGASGRVAATGKPLLMPRVSLADFAASAAPQYRELLERMNMGSLIIIPMLCRGKVAGVATLMRSGSEHPYTEQEVQLVERLADHAALAISNSRSHAAERAARAAAVQANEALQKSELAHRLLFESSPIPLIVLDVETLELLAVNDAAARLYGYSRAELLRMTLLHLLPVPTREGTLARLAALGDGEAVGLARHIRRDGTAFFAEHASRIVTFDGRKARFTLIADVTSRQDAEEMRALLAAIVQSSNDAIVSQRLDGTITSWNSAAERLFGYSAVEAIEQPFALLVPRERLSEGRDLLARVAAGERVEHYETVRRHKDGREFAISLSLAPIFDASGRVIGASNTGRDLSALRKAEEALRATAEQLRQAQKMDAVGRLAGGIAHDFNNLLSVILGYSELLLQDLPPSEPASVDLGEIRKAALNAAELTRQLLVFSRKQVVAPKVIDLNEVIASVDKMVRRIIGEDIDLVSSPGADLAPVLADRSNVEQAILNLVVNARDAMPKGGKLTIETCNVTLDLEYTSRHAGAAPGPHVLLAVSDTGVGIERDIQQRIFEPFFTTKPVGMGTGLGLSTVFGIAQQSGGTVWVYSEPGKGATFKLYFPAVQAELDRLSPSVAPPALPGTETILLVEDQEQVRAVAHSILKRNGYRVLVAQHAHEALLLCDTHDGPIHLLLTDVVMPQLSGAELATRVQAQRPTIKVLYMSGYTDDSVVRHGILESEMAFLQKPFTPESLTQKVREVIGAA